MRDGVGQQAALVETDVTRRRADQARHRMLFHVLAHVEAHELDAQDLSELLGDSVLPTPVGPEKRKQPIGFSGMAKPRARKLDGAGQRVDGRVLAEDR